jgi:DNA-binding MarR family transcriptional regulator
MHASSATPCNCLAFRQAARHVSQVYDQALAPFGLRTSQFSILVRLAHSGPWTIQALADRLVMDRTSLGRTVRPLERDGLVAMQVDAGDRRLRVLRITDAGRERLRIATAGWQAAQARFETVIGESEAASIRNRLDEVSRTAF